MRKELLSEEDFTDHYGHKSKYSYFGYNVNGIIFFSRVKSIKGRDTSISWSRVKENGTRSDKWEAGKTNFLKSLGLQNKDLK